MSGLFSSGRADTHKTKTAMLPAGHKPAIPASEAPQTHALDRAATGDRGTVSYFTKISQTFLQLIIDLFG